LLEIRRLKLAGFAFQQSDLKYNDWLLLGALEEKLEAKKKELKLKFLNKIILGPGGSLLSG